MNFGVFILASTSVPILAHNGYWLLRERKIEEYYGVASGIYTILAAIAVAYGFPGSLVLPIAFSIIGFGGLHAFINSHRKSKAIKFALFIMVALIIYVMGVLL